MIDRDVFCRSSNDFHHQAFSAKDFPQMTTSDYSTKSARRKHRRRPRVDRFVGKPPTAIEELPSYLKGESQNRFGGSNSTFVKAGSFYSKRGKDAGNTHTLSKEQYDQIKEQAEKADFKFGSASSLRNTPTERRRRGRRYFDQN